MIAAIMKATGLSNMAVKIGLGVIAVAIMSGLLATAYFKGKSAQRAEYAAMALETAKKAREASEAATAGKDKRDGEFAIEQAEIEDAVKEAINNGDDPVATYFDELRKAQSGSGKTASK